MSDTPGRPAAFHPVSTVDALEAAIRTEVLTGAIPAGAQLREKEITDRYEVGRNSLRSALQALVHSGLLRHEQNRGVFVPRLTVEDVDDLYHVRIALEADAVRTIVRQSAGWAEVEDAVRRLQQLGPDADWLAAVEIDLELHAALVAATGSRRMIRIFRGLLGEQRLLLAQVKDQYPHPGVLGQIHQELVQALRAGDEQQAVAAITLHLVESAAEVRAIVESRGG